MKIIKIDSWQDYKIKIKEIRDGFGIKIKGTILEDKKDILFRGQGNHEWKLETTLERYTSEKFTSWKYIERATHLIEEIESLTNTAWNLPPRLNIRELCKKDTNSFFNIPCYEYLAYLRHFGYPSPLLDWSNSPYIAAFFALSEINHDADPAVFVYVLPDMEGGESKIPRINNHGPYIKTHKRHYAQKSWYTTATIRNDDFHTFVSHDEAFKKAKNHNEHFFKLVLSSTMRREALEDLNDSNINHFSIFNNEDSLIKSIAMKTLFHD